MGSRRRVAAVTAVCAAALLAVGSAAGPVHAQSSAPAAGDGDRVSCDADYAISNEWPGGFTADITVTNTGTVTVAHWQVRVTLPDGDVTVGWNADHTVNGDTVVAGGDGWNASLPPGSSVTVGVTGTGDGSPSGIGVECGHTLAS